MSEELEKKVFLKGVDEGATKFYKSLAKHLHEKDTVIHNDKIGKEALNDIINLSTMSAKLIGAVTLAVGEENKEIYIHGQGVIVGTELFGKSLELLLEEHGHICWQALRKTWPIALVQIKQHVSEVMNDRQTVH